MSFIASLRPLSLAAALGVAGSSLGLAPAPVAAQEMSVASGAYTLDKNHASVSFTVMHLGLSNYLIRMTDFDIDLTIDGDNPAASSVSAVVNPLSVSTEFEGDKDFNDHIGRGDRFFNGEAFPEITFTSTRVDVTGDRTATIYGDFTLLGVTKEIALDAVLNGALVEHPFMKKPALGFTATGVIDRTEFGLDFLAPEIVGVEVTIRVEAEFIKTD